MRAYRFRYMVVMLLSLGGESHAFSLWSTHQTFGGTGEFLGPGLYDAPQPLFEMVLKNLLFHTQTDFIVPFYNNGKALPNICGEMDSEAQADGSLSNGQRINENADMCLANVAGTDMVIAVVEEGVHGGRQNFLILEDGNILVSMDIAFDLGIGEKGVIRMPFYGTTGRVSIPLSLQTRLDIPGGANRAGKYASGDVLEGRLGDADGDGWLDGTMVAVGNIPLESPVFPGQPYAMIRHFEMDIPVGGYVLGDVKAIHSQDNANLYPKRLRFRYAE